jgi:sensor histidine kinase regulating citrate/malate metabolism
VALAIEELDPKRHDRGGFDCGVEPLNRYLRSLAAPHRTKGSKGMGIGAYQVREYVLSLGGRVDVASEEGQGTRFTLRLPLAEPGAGTVP